MRGIGDPHAVVQLVFLLQAAQDRDRVLDGRLVDDRPAGSAAPARRPSPRASVFVERGGADAVQLAARQRRLEQVGGVHRAFGLAGADEGVHLVDEQDDQPLGERSPRCSTAFSRSSNSPRYFAPAISAPMSSASSFLSFRLSGTSPLTMRRPGLRRWRSCRRRARRSARDCSWCGGTAPGWCGGFPRRGRSPDRACRRGRPGSGRGHISSARHRRSRPTRCRRCGPCAAPDGGVEASAA